MKQDRWLRIIPVALLMYTISYIDRTNVSLALDPSISKMMKDLLMDDKMKGEAAGIFFFGYLLLQIPGGHFALRWSARKLISLCLVAWGVCAIGCGLTQSFQQFEVMRFFLGVAESAVFPATLVLLANWFPRAERARANNGWLLCQPLAVAGSAPITGWLLGMYGWRLMLMFEGLLPFLFLPVWWFCIRDHPREAKWISDEEKNYLETTLQKESLDREPPQKISMLARLAHPSVFVMVALYFLHNCAAYGSMTFFTNSLKGQGFSPLQYGILFAVPYAVTAVVMVLNSWHSDKTGERRGHVAAVYLMSGVSLILSVFFSSQLWISYAELPLQMGYPHHAFFQFFVSNHFWISYVLLCLAIPGPFAAMAPFWAIPGETLPRSVMGVVMGLVNAFGNLGGFVGPYIVGWLAKVNNHSTAAGFTALGIGMLGCAGLAFLLPKSQPQISAAPVKS